MNVKDAFFTGKEAENFNEIFGTQDTFCPPEEIEEIEEPDDPAF